MSASILPQDLAGPLAIGRTVTFSKTVSESDIYGMAGISGDFSRMHIDEQYMKSTRYGRRIAHGALVVAFMSTCSARLLDGVDVAAVSYGYDGVRFIRPVFAGDTVTVEYTVAERDDAKGEIRSQIKAVNQEGEVVAVATHILRLV